MSRNLLLAGSMLWVVTGCGVLDASGDDPEADRGGVSRTEADPSEADDVPDAEADVEAAPDDLASLRLAESVKCRNGEYPFFVCLSEGKYKIGCKKLKNIVRSRTVVCPDNRPYCHDNGTRGGCYRDRK
jgi:hypothetical protein